MRIFCYGRHSVFSETSDSVDNQIRMCRSYCDSRFPGQIDLWEVFSDEDYSGATADRPALKRMLGRLRDKQADALVVYQLDRLSRNVRDFSNIYAMLEERNILFISLKENIDTTTPIGRAMMYVTITFAQMERETTAMRVTDNLIGLAKKGFWPGGNAPAGYVRQRVTEDGRSHVIIVPDPDGVAYVRRVFADFLRLDGSLQHMETVYRRQGIRTQAGSFFTTSQLHRLLTMPFCVEATPEVYDYYAALGCRMDPGSPRSAWDGSVGVMIYGRTSQHKGRPHTLTPPDAWIVSLGRQEPFIPASEWLEVQSRFRRHKCIREARWPVPLLKGVLRCAHCGNLMQIARKAKVDGSRSSWYYCRKRVRQGPEVCPMGAIKCEKLDDEVLTVFRRIASDPEQIRQYVSETVPDAAADPAALDQKIRSLESKISRLTESLTLAEGSAAAKYIIAEMDKLDKELGGIRRQRMESEAARREARMVARDMATKAEEIRRLIEGFDGFTPEERNAVARSVIRSATWDGETLSLAL